MNKKAAMWAFNFLASVGIIAITLFGFFLLMNYLGPGDITGVRASVVDARTGSQLINLFRIPVKEKVAADIVNDIWSVQAIGHEPYLVDCNDFGRALTDFYGRDVNYSLSLDEHRICTRGDINKPVLLKLVLPSYTKVINVSLEVAP